jgi:hypothetical protein
MALLIFSGDGWQPAMAMSSMSALHSFRKGIGKFLMVV